MCRKFLVALCLGLIWTADNRAQKSAPAEADQGRCDSAQGLCLSSRPVNASEPLFQPLRGLAGCTHQAVVAVAVLRSLLLTWTTDIRETCVVKWAGTAARSD